ncbi:VWA domain-containing protein [Terriglobus sp.]|uniref:VWA domain-containing protein n=1 Tax=Terriglobus sp. TaxID=1889013 RepID=UPI003B0008B7
MPDLPVVRSTTRDIQLDVVVTDSAGRTVQNLSQSDFVVTEDGVEQQTHLLEAPQKAAPSAGARDGSATRAEATNGPSPQTTVNQRQRTLILLDEVNISFLDLAFARNRLDVFLASTKAADQAIALMALTDHKLVLIHDFSTDRAALRKALRELPAVLPGTANVAVDEYQDYANFTHAVSALETIGRSLQGSPIRTNCIWITSGFVTMAKLVNSPEVGANFEIIMEHTANLYLGARMSVYTVDPHGVQFETSLPSHEAQPGLLPPGGVLEDNGAQFARQTTNLTSNSAVINSLLNKLDERTGGRAYENQNFIDVPIGQALDDASGSYLLAYAPRDRNFHGEYRHIHVELRTPGLHARTRDGYIATDRNKENTASDVKAQLERALESPLPYTGLQTSARLDRKGKHPVLHLTLTPDNIEWQTSVSGTGGVIAQAIAVEAYTKSGKPLYNRLYQVTTNRPDLQSREALRYDLPFAMPAETARLRVAVMDQHGSRVGTTDVPPTDLTTSQQP